MKRAVLTANGVAISTMKIGGEDYISLTDIAWYKNAEFPADVVRNWMRSKMTVAFLSLREQLHNPDFKLVEFDQFKNEAGTNAFVLPPQVWIEKTNAKGLISKKTCDNVYAKLVRLANIPVLDHAILGSPGAWLAVFSAWLHREWREISNAEVRNMI